MHGQVRQNMNEILLTLCLAAASVLAGFDLDFGDALPRYLIFFDFFISVVMIFTLHRSRGIGNLKPYEWLALIPGHGVSVQLGLVDFYVLFAYLPRALAIPHLIGRFRHLRDNFSLPSWFNFAAIILGSALTIHWLAIFWLQIYPKPDLDLYTAYNLAVYWAITTLTTIGYGDITPTTNGGRLFTMVIMILGVGFYGLVIGQVSSMMLESDKRLAKMKHKLESLSSFFKHYEIPYDLQKDVLKFYNHLMKNQLNEDEQKVMSELPLALQSELRVYMNLKPLSGIDLFAGCSFSCLKAASESLEQRCFAPGEQILKTGEKGEEMYVIGHGKVTISKNGSYLTDLEQGHCFGEIALIEDTLRTADVTAVSYCDLYRLDKAKFAKLMADHKDLAKNVKNLIAKRKKS